MSKYRTPKRMSFAAKARWNYAPGGDVESRLQEITRVVAFDAIDDVFRDLRVRPVLTKAAALGYWRPELEVYLDDDNGHSGPPGDEDRWVRQFDLAEVLTQLSDLSRDDAHLADRFASLLEDCAGKIRRRAQQR